MKITYPECQVEITAEELITVIDRLNLYSAGARLVKAIEEIKINLRPEDFPQDGDGEAPEPKPYPKEEEPTPTYEPGGIIGDGNSSKSGEGILPAGLPAAVKEALKHPHVVRTKCEAFNGVKGRKHESTEEAPEKKPVVKSKSVDVLMEDGWVTFETGTKAAKALGVSLAWLSKSLKLGKTCNGHQVRYSNPELDAALAEIEQRNKEPYEPSKKV
jgi:hypothetical protein